MESAVGGGGGHVAPVIWPGSAGNKEALVRLAVTAPILLLSTLATGPALASVLDVSADVAGRTLLSCLHPTGTFRGAADLPPDDQIATLKDNFGANASRGIAIEWSGLLTDRVYRTDIAMLVRGTSSAAAVRMEVLADDSPIPPIDRRCRDELDWLQAQ